MEKILDELIKKHNLTHIKKLIESHIIDSIRIKTKKVEEDKIPLGKTKIGGRPDLPKCIDWQKNENGELAFVAQINFEEIKDFSFEKPESGILYFFYDTLTIPMGYAPEHKNGWKIIYSEEKELIRKEFPMEINEDYCYEPNIALKFDEEITIPVFDSDLIHILHEKDKEKYIDLYFEFEQKLNVPVHRMFGHANAMQGEMQWQCEIVSSGINIGRNDYELPEHLEDINNTNTEWILLLQIDSDEESGMNFGMSEGKIFLWIKKRRFKE